MKLPINVVSPHPLLMPPLHTTSPFSVWHQHISWLQKHHVSSWRTWVLLVLTPCWCPPLHTTNSARLPGVAGILQGHGMKWTISRNKFREGQSVSLYYAGHDLQVDVIHKKGLVLYSCFMSHSNRLAYSVIRATHVGREIMLNISVGVGLIQHLLHLFYNS